MEQENLKPCLASISHSVASEIAVYSHTLALLMSKLRSSIEASKKQPIVWLEYGCSMAEVTLYLSFDGLLVLHWPPSGVMVDTRYIHGGYTEILRRTQVTYIVSRRRNGNLTGGDTLDNVGSSANETGFMVLCTYVRGLINPYLFLVIRLSMERSDILLIISELEGMSQS